MMPDEDGSASIEVVVYGGGGPDDDELATGILETLLERYDPQATTTAALTKSERAVWEELRRVLEKEARRRGPHDEPLAMELDTVPWVVTIAVPLSALLTSFLSEAGKDAYLGLKRMVGRIAEAAREKHGRARVKIGDELIEGRIEVYDSETGVRLHLSENLPKRAYKELAALALPWLPDNYFLRDLSWVRGSWCLKVEVPAPRQKPESLPVWMMQTPIIVKWQAAERRWLVIPD